MRPLSDEPGVRSWFCDRRVLVVGLGKSGVAAARLLTSLGAGVFVTDKKTAQENKSWLSSLPPGMAVECGAHRSFEKKWDLVVMSPGVPLAVLPSHLKETVPVWGEIELAYRILSLAQRWPRWSVAITGTNGKTTTTALLGAIFKETGVPTVVAGNIGTPLCSVVEQITSRTALALEISSYQLETCQRFAPTVGAILNVTPDHLGRHGTMAGYAQAKGRLFQAFGSHNVAVLNAQDRWCRSLAPRKNIFWFAGSLKEKGVRSQGQALVGLGGRWPWPTHLPGEHNIQNASVAVVCARVLGVPSGAIARGLQRFRGVDHRLQTVRERHGVRFINDSKATNVDSTRVALQAVPGPLYLILGGEHKGSPYTPLADLMGSRVKEILCIGEASPLIAKDLNGVAPIVLCGTLDKAVERAMEKAVAGDTVLLSPACASFDQFDHFEHRGQTFVTLVNKK